MNAPHAPSPPAPHSPPALRHLKRPLAAEALGTFALVFAGTGAIVIDQTTGGGVSHVGVAATFGLIVMSMIYTFGDVSGAHLNPAVTLAFSIAGRFPRQKVIPYIVAQLAGAFAASAALLAPFGNLASLGATIPRGSDGQSFFLEVILTCTLMLVILNVSAGSKEVGTLAGIAIGGVIALEAMFAGPISGASMNPARSLAPAVLSGNLNSLWVYLSAPVLGACLAVPLWQIAGPIENRKSKIENSSPTPCATNAAPPADAPAPPA